MTGKKWFLLTIVLFIAALVAVAGNYNRWFKGQAEERVEQPDAKAEYQKISERFLKQDSLVHLAGDIRLYDGEDTSVLKEENSFQFIREGKYTYSRLGYLQTFCDDQLVIQVDTLNRYLVVGEAQPPVAGGNNLQQAINLLFNDTAAFGMRGIVSGNSSERTISVSSDYQPEVRVYHLTYDARNYQLKNAVVEWWKDAVVLDTTRTNRVWITKIGYQYQPLNGISVKERMDDILVRRSGKILPGERYNDYQVHFAMPQEP